MDRIGQRLLHLEPGQMLARRAAPADGALWNRLAELLPLLISLGLGTAALCSAALINGGPIMYPDTLNYLADGHALVRLTTPDNTRPVFYGLAIELLHWEWSAWPVIVAQAFVIAHLIYLTMRTVLGAVAPVMVLAAIVLLVILTPVSWYVAHLLPDMFSGVVILGMFLLAFGWRRLGRLELGYLTLLTTAGICFHLTNFVTGAALCVGAWVAHFVWRMGRPVLPTVAFLLAVAGLFTSSLVLYGRVTLTPKSPPHFMARIIADGPGRTYLEQSCPTQHYFVCADLDRLPRTENGILWQYMAHLNDADGRLFRADAGAIVGGTLRAFPAEVAGHMLLNTLDQVVTFDSGTEMDAYWWAHLTQPEFLVRAVDGTLQQQDRLGPILAFLNVVHALAVIAGAVGGVVVFVRSRNPKVRQLIATVGFALAVNAFAAGALGGVFGRYQGRVIWLVPAAAMLGALATSGARRKAAVPSVRQIRWATLP